MAYLSTYTQDDAAFEAIASAQGERDAWADYCSRMNNCPACCGNGYFSTGNDWLFDTRDCAKCDGKGEVK